jgi:midasin (ATPase involved in ribosome maturation)
VLAGKALLLIGDAGSGKNCLLETLAWIFQRPYFDMSINAQTDKYDLQGSQTIEARETDNGNVVQKVVFTPEILIVAMETGAICNIADINFADPGVACLLHSIIDNRRAISVAGYRRVVADEYFLLTATMNQGYAGTREMSPALKSRPVAIKCKMPESIENILMEACKYATKKDISTCNKIYKKILAASSDTAVTIDVQVSSRDFIGALELVDTGLSLFEALEMTIIDKVEDDDYCKAIHELIQMNCPN